jgi:riboflavin synthase
MFTGLIETVGQLIEREPTDGGARIAVAASLAGRLSRGDSVAVSGVCLTVTTFGDDRFDADVGPETLRVTTLGTLQPGALVNLERPVRPDGRLGGHFVQGHVDAVGRIERLRTDSDFRWLTVSFPPDLAPYIVPRGSIAVDGISLTVAALRGASFDVMLVPHTLDHTNLKTARQGDRVNLESDLVGKYVVRALETTGARQQPDQPPVTIR